MAEPTTPEKQCRICLDGEDLALGRLIRPCLCKGSMSVNTSVHDSSNPSQLLIYRQFVHVGCLKRWRDSSPSKNFFSCPVCHYQYRLGRTRVVGIATNPGNYMLATESLFNMSTQWSWGRYRRYCSPFSFSCPHTSPPTLWVH